MDGLDCGVAPRRRAACAAAARRTGRACCRGRSRRRASRADQLAPAHTSPGLAASAREQPELGRRQRRLRRRSPRDRVRDRDRAADAPTRGRRVGARRGAAARAAGRPARRSERLGQVVVAPGAEPASRSVSASRAVRKSTGASHAARPQRLADVAPVGVGQADVDDQRVGHVRRRRATPRRRRPPPSTAKPASPSPRRQQRAQVGDRPRRRAGGRPSRCPAVSRASAHRQHHAEARVARPSSCRRPPAPRPAAAVSIRGRTPVSAENASVSSESFDVPEAWPWTAVEPAIRANGGDLERVRRRADDDELAAGLEAAEGGRHRGAAVTVARTTWRRRAPGAPRRRPSAASSRCSGGRRARAASGSFSVPRAMATTSRPILRRVLDPEVAEAADAEDRHEVARPGDRPAQRVERRDARAQQRGGVGVGRGRRGCGRAPPRGAIIASA